MKIIFPSRVPIFLSIVFVFLLSTDVFAQNKVITGKVTDPDGNPLEGVTVSPNKGSKAVLTRADGTYQLPITKRMLM